MREPPELSRYLEPVTVPVAPRNCNFMVSTLLGRSRRCGAAPGLWFGIARARSTQHVGLAEILARVFEQLAVARMVGALDAQHLGGLGRMVLEQVFHQFEFFMARADDQDLGGLAQRPRHVVEIGLALGRVAGTDGAGLGVQMGMRRVGLDDLAVGGVGIKMDHVSLLVIYPRYNMIEGHKILR